MKTAYLAISFSNRPNLESEVAAMKTALAQYDYTLQVFVDSYIFVPGQEARMMQQGCDDIQAADLVLAEVSDKAIGVGIEIGYAVAVSKPLVYLRNERTEYSKTVGGMTPHQIVYTDPEDLRKQLEEFLKDFV